MRPKVIALWLSAGLPFLGYVLSASGFAYWLDSGELVATAVQLDIAHPPGHPLSMLWGKAWSFLPVGSLSFRVAVGQAFASAFASALHCLATAHALRGLRLDATLRWSLALFAAWLSAFTYALWFQAVRPEVYALQTLCVAAMCERLLAQACRDEPADSKPLASAALALGLGLANHHLTALLVAPAFLPALWQCLRRRHFRSLTLAGVSGLLGLCTYAYLPLRATHDLPVNLGTPSNLERFLWVVSARVYARVIGPDAAQPLATRALDVLELWLEDVGLLAVLGASIALYLGLRLRSTRQPTLVLALVWGVDAAFRAWMGPVRANPDILGYLAPSFLAIGSLAALALGTLAWSVTQERPAAQPGLRRTAWLWPLVTWLLIPASFERGSLRSFTATDTVDELRRRHLPARSVVIESNPQTVFRSWELAAVEGDRPDLQSIPLPFLRYPGVADALIVRAPHVSEVVDGYLGAHDRLALAPMLALARHRPVFVELDTRVAPETYRYLVPEALLGRMNTSAVPLDRARTAAELAATDQQLKQRLAGQVHETETARQLLWIHYMQAIQLGVLGQPALALTELARARDLHPEEARLPQLEQALRAARAFDPQPFLEF